MKTAFLFILLTLFLSPVHAAESKTNENSDQPFAVYQTLPAKKSLLTSSQFAVLDDFNSGRMKTRRGAQWQVKSPAIGALDLELVNEDARNPDRGYSLKGVFNLAPHESARVITLLNRMDVSQAQYFVFKCKISTDSQNPKFTGRWRVALTDWRHKKVIRDITTLCSENQNVWVDVIVPISDFKTLDLDQLFSLEFTLVAGNDNLRGELQFDEIAFYGSSNVEFESLRDNLVGFPSEKINVKKQKQLQDTRDHRAFLKIIAEDTWKYFTQAIDRETGLVVDHLRVGDFPLAADYTSPTNIAMDLLATVSAHDLGFISRQEALSKLKRIITTLQDMRRYKGFFYNFYDTKKLQISRSYISTVDMGWLAVGLVVVRQAFPHELKSQITQILNDFSFEELLDTENNQLVVGIEIPERNFGQYHYGLLVSEARTTSFYAIGKGDLPRDHWWFLFRTLPQSWKWQTQVPQGTEIEHDGLPVFEGYYSYQDKKFVPSWGGSLFEFLMPTLVMKERELGPWALGLNDRRAAELQRDYALKEKKYPVWGISPAAITSGRRWDYAEFGVKMLGAKGYPDRGIITPHVSFLALDVYPEEALANIRRLLKYDIYGEYGFYDSVNVKSKQANHQYLALDQGMILVAISNYLTGGAIQERFHADPIGRQAEELLMKESFFTT